MNSKKVKLADYYPLPKDDRQYPPEYIEANRVIKLGESADRITVGYVSDTKEDVFDQLEHFHDKPVSFLELEKNEFSAFLTDLFSRREWEDSGSRESGDDGNLLDKLANDAPIINLVNNLIIEAINAGASDIHIESFSEEAVVRYRVDGKLKVGRKIDKEQFPAVASRLKIMANLNIIETRRPQDGRISVFLNERKTDIRVSVVPIVRGESLVLRILNRDQQQLQTLEDLGFTEKDCTGFRSLYSRLTGLVLVTGPTGSGKTTTLNAVLRELNLPDRKIITIEDPVEFVLDGIDQIQTNEKIGLTFDSLLRRVLRQDPDIIMIGEIRDLETAELAVRAALTGHLVFATLHTNDAVTAIQRLNNMGIPDYLLASVLNGALSQRLIRRICPQCREKRAVSPSEKALLKQFNIDIKEVFEGTGCEACHKTGFSGRVAVIEWFAKDEKIEELITRRASSKEIKDYLAGINGTSFRSDGFNKVRDGSTTLKELEGVLLI